MHPAGFMRAGELCVRDVVTAYEDESAFDVARRMADYKVGDVVVVAAGAQTRGQPRPIGIVTDRDLVVQVLASPNRIPAQVRVGDIMHRDLVVAAEDNDIESVIARLRQHGIRRIPVVDADGGLQGMLSLDDVLGWMRDQLDATSRALDAQSRGPIGAVR